MFSATSVLKSGLLTGPESPGFTMSQLVQQIIYNTDRESASLKHIINWNYNVLQDFLKKQRISSNKIPLSHHWCPNRNVWQWIYLQRPALCLYFLISFFCCCTWDFYGLQPLGSGVQHPANNRAQVKSGLYEKVVTRCQTVSSVHQRRSYKNGGNSAEKKATPTFHPTLFTHSNRQFLHSLPLEWVLLHFCHSGPCLIPVSEFDY